MKFIFWYQHLRNLDQLVKLILFYLLLWFSLSFLLFLCSFLQGDITYKCQLSCSDVVAGPEPRASKSPGCCRKKFGRWGMLLMPKHFFFVDILNVYTDVRYFVSGKSIFLLLHVEPGVMCTLRYSAYLYEITTFRLSDWMFKWAERKGGFGTEQGGSQGDHPIR